MKRVLLLLLSLSLVQLAFSQKYLMLAGQTRNETMEVIPYANVIALDTTTNEMEAFAVTDINGDFKLRLREGVTYQLKVTYVGYIPYIQTLSLDQSNESPFLIVLSASATQLDQVTVEAEMPVIISGDTISYKAEAFADGDERKLEDVLEDLPGFEITDNGEIEVQGKRVEKVMVDGKEFFEGDTKLATKNIPADVVDRVQVLQNFNDIAPLQGLQDNDRLALNIALKKDKKRIVFGDIEAGGGPNNRYFGHLNSFYYSPKTSINWIGDGNNVGQLALSLNDYFRMSGGLSSLASRNGTNFRFNSSEADIPLVDRNSARRLTSQLGAFNITSSFTNGLTVSGFMIGFANDNDLGSNALRTYPQLENATQEELKSRSIIENMSGLARVGVKYTPNYNSQLDYSLFVKSGMIGESQWRDSRLIESQNVLNQEINRSPFSMTQRLRYFRAISDKHIVSAELSLEVEENVTDRLLISDQFLFDQFLGVGNQSLNQQMTNESNRVNSAFNYYYIINKTTHLNAALGYNTNLQNLDARLYNAEAIDQDITNELNIINGFTRFSLRKKWNKLTINSGISLNNYQTRLLERPRINNQFVFPSLNAEYDFSNAHSLSLNLAQSVEYNEVLSYSDGLFLNGYNTLLNGSTNLRPALTNTYALNYQNFNSYNFLNFYASINHQEIKDGFVQNQQLNGIESRLTTLNSNDRNQITGFNSSIEKRFNHWRISGRANIRRTQLFNQLNALPIKNVNITQQYTFNFSAKLFKIWSLRAGYSVAKNNYSAAEINTVFFNYRPEASTTLVWKGLRVAVDYAKNNYLNQAQNQRSTFDELDASINYRKGKSPWEFSIKGWNLLNTQEIRRDSFANNLISTYAYFIQQRYGIITVKYDI